MGSDAPSAGAGTGAGAHQQSDYLRGLEHLRGLVSSIGGDLDRVKRVYYGSDVNDDDRFERHLRDINDKLLYCNAKLRAHDVELAVVDSELRLVALLNTMRHLPVEDVDAGVVKTLTAFWQRQQTTLDEMRALTLSFRVSVLKRLKSSCRSYDSKNVTLKLSKQYSRDVRRFQADVVKALRAGDDLARSYANGIDQKLFCDVDFSARVLLCCDHKAFPVLRLVPDVACKLERACALASAWIDRDASYVKAISAHIAETRSRTLQKEEDLRQQQEQQTLVSAAAEDAYVQFRANKRTLARIEAELKTLESQVRQFKAAQRYKVAERRQKEGIVVFLEISIAQTRKRRSLSLQLQRSRLTRQLRELEESLRDIGHQLAAVHEEMTRKAVSMATLADKAQRSNAAYRTLRRQLDLFTANVRRLQADVLELSDSLEQLESIQTFKTSPERVDEFYEERPHSVRLAPSLREKIRRKRRMQNERRLRQR